MMSYRLGMFGQAKPDRRALFEVPRYDAAVPIGEQCAAHHNSADVMGLQSVTSML